MCGNEESFTKVSNKLMDAVERYPGTAIKHQILIHLIRRTAGFHRDSVLTSATAIASSIHRDKIKTGLALNALIECGIVIADSKEGPCRTRRLSLNMNTMEWRPNPLRPGAGTNEDSNKQSTHESENNNGFSCNEGQNNVSRAGNSEVSHPDTPSSNPGNFDPSLEGNSEVSQIGYSRKHAYIDGKNENSGPKENIKEKERNKYMYDITLIPKTLSEMPGFIKAFNNWCIYRQEIEKPLTGIGIDVQMRKLLLYNSEGFNVISIIENSISAGWPDIYRPGGRQASPSKSIEYKTIEELENESY